MTDISNWTYYYKLRPDGVATDSNLLYTPYVNPEGNVMCMHYCYDPVYRPGKEQISQDLIDWFYQREVRFLCGLADISTTPTVYEIDRKSNKIFIEWNKETLSQILFDKNRNIDQEFPTWKQEIYSMLENLKAVEHFKMALYPHCFYISKDNSLKSIDYYSVVPFNERYVERKIIEGVIGKDGEYRFDESTENGLIDFKKFFKLTLTKHLSMSWPNSPFPTIYEKLYATD